MSLANFIIVSSYLFFVDTMHEHSSLHLSNSLSLLLIVLLNFSVYCCNLRLLSIKFTFLFDTHILSYYFVVFLVLICLFVINILLYQLLRCLISFSILCKCTCLLWFAFAIQIILFYCCLLYFVNVELYLRFPLFQWEVNCKCHEIKKELNSYLIFMNKLY